MNGYKRILVPTDFSRASLMAAQHAIEHAPGGASVVLLHVDHQPIPAPPRPMIPPVALVELDALDKELDQMAQNLRSLNPDITLDTRVARGEPAQTVVDESASFDLIVMAAQERGRIARFLLGSVADDIVRGAHCPVLVVRS